jgi:hypothetical protein
VSGASLHDIEGEEEKGEEIMAAPVAENDEQ